MDIYPSINIEGQILSSEILTKLSQEGTKFQRPEDYGLSEKDTLRDEIQFAYSLARQQWQIFKQKLDRLDEEDTGTTETRRFWMLPLFDALGYNPEFSNAEIVNKRSYAISHRDEQRNGFPLHTMSTRDSMDRTRDYGGPRLSPHGLVQEYLNVTEHLYGLVSNGLKLRVLRDSTRLSRLSYIEFDLEAMMEDELYTDFAVMFRLIHASRMPVRREDSAESFIEYYHQDAIESGARIRERLREKVEETLRLFGNGFLTHPDNEALRELFADEEIDATEYYSTLLKVIYRLLFLMVIEERNLVYPNKDQHEERWDGELTKEYRKIYHNYYSIHRIRELAEKRHQLDLEAEDLWEQLQRTFLLFEKEAYGERLGIQALNGDLFSPKALDPLNECTLKNGILLRAIDAIARFENEYGQLTRVNYGALDVEEFGSVYESLLDHEALVRKGSNTKRAEGWQFGFAEGTERKTTGSYYTRTELVQELIKSALAPVIEERLESAETDTDKINALLNLKVCDPAVGSGHFLLAAARKIAEHIAILRSGEEQPPPHDYRLALREVVRHCIYGVDMNPMAVELCRVALWLESHAVGYPLTFLDHHIKCGNSLVGLDDRRRLDKGIPDGAFKDVLGDEKEIAKKLKKRNRKERKAGKQTGLLDSVGSGEHAFDRFARRREEIDAMPDGSIEEIQQKAEAYTKFKQDQAYQDALQAANIWTGAFFVEKTAEFLNKNLVPTTQRLHSFIAAPRGTHARFTGTMNALAEEHRFFHWPLEFPEVEVQGGFDVVLGNPPWDVLQPEETKFFKGKNDKIANAKSAKRKKLIKNLEESEPTLFKEWVSYYKSIKRSVLFISRSGLFPLTSKGKINLYSSFAEKCRLLGKNNGFVGIIIQSDIATSKSNTDFFSSIIDRKQLSEFHDFVNREGIFPGIHRTHPHFCVFVLDLEGTSERANYSFHNTNPNHLLDSIRQFQLSKKDFESINPNTLSCPIFRTEPDAKIARKIYSNFPILFKKGRTNDDLTQNFWKVQMSQGLFNMSSDSDLFFEEEKNELFPLYEAKYVWHFDHRFSTYEKNKDGDIDLREVEVEEKNNTDYSIQPRYWINKREVLYELTDVPEEILHSWKSGEFEQMKKNVGWWLYGYENVYSSSKDYISLAGLEEYVPTSDKEVEGSQSMAQKLKFDGEDLNKLIEDGIEDALEFIIKKYSPQWFLVFRNITNSTNERTIIPCIMPAYGVGHSAEVVISSLSKNVYLLLANFATLVLDFIARLKMGGTNLSLYVIEQLPVLKPDDYTQEDKEFIKKRVLELTYTSNDLKPFAESLGYDGEPFPWDEERRGLLKAELDAYYARLYGLTEKELLYILDPEAVYGEDFPGETFRVLKNKEIKKYGEYRTRELVMDAWERLEKGRPMRSEEEELVDSLSQSEHQFPSIKLVKPFKSSFDTQAVIIMNLIKEHGLNPDFQKHLGHVKCEKVCHIIEYEAGLSQERIPLRDAAGPVDFQHLSKTEYRAKKKGWFTPRRDKNSGYYSYNKGRVFDIELFQFNEQLKEKYPEQFKKMNKIIELFLPFDREESEVKVTVYAAWNDLLIDGINPEEEEIVTEARENWHPEKLKIKRVKFFKAIEWLNQNDLVPKGVGKHTIRK